MKLRTLAPLGLTVAIAASLAWASRHLAAGRFVYAVGSDAAAATDADAHRFDRNRPQARVLSSPT